ncbi:hypothetical protein HHK36_027994 [Tetracentron sinense]|uniref:BHLH domain-containing protein n=1 Tax=Tetracentron sinense TaxID=13715 RepID=A0A834YIG2_TETSI|nr:hypothetical protein HHK36_027994 [Tetracentron sinense]
MSQCVPSWDLDENRPSSARLTLRADTAAAYSSASDIYNGVGGRCRLDYEVAELTWENGQLSMHGLGLPRKVVKPFPSSSSSKFTWEKPRANGTLESIVNQATRLPPPPKTPFGSGGGGGNDELVPWFDHHVAAVAAAATMTMDALVPCSNKTTSVDDHSTQVPDPNRELGTCAAGSSTPVGSCSGAPTLEPTRGRAEDLGRKRARVARLHVSHDGSSTDQSGSGSETFGRDSRQVTLDTCEIDLGLGFTSTSLGSPENTSSGMPRTSCTKSKAVDDHDSAGIVEDKKKGQIGKSSISTKRSRAAAIHNQSERKRRDKINQRMKTLQKLVPNSSKISYWFLQTDKASMLDEVIEYLKQLQAQVQMMNGMNMSHMMLPMTMQQQLQMSMMAQMGMGMSMGMGMGMGVMDINSMARPNITGIPPVLHPSAFMPMAPWDASGSDRLAASTAIMPDLMSAFLACQTQPMTMDAYSRLAALYQQMHQPPASSSKKLRLERRCYEWSNFLDEAFRYKEAIAISDPSALQGEKKDSAIIVVRYKRLPVYCFRSSSIAGNGGSSRCQFRPVISGAKGREVGSGTDMFSSGAGKVEQVLHPYDSVLALGKESGSYTCLEAGTGDRNAIFQDQGVRPVLYSVEPPPTQLSLDSLFEACTARYDPYPERRGIRLGPLEPKGIQVVFLPCQASRRLILLVVGSQLRQFSRMIRRRLTGINPSLANEYFKLELSRDRATLDNSSFVGARL